MLSQAEYRLTENVVMITHMNLNDPQRAKLIEADSIASKIAMCEADEQTIRAGVMYCLSNSIEGFAGLR